VKSLLIAVIIFATATARADSYSGPCKVRKIKNKVFAIYTSITTQKGDKFTILNGPNSIRTRILKVDVSPIEEYDFKLYAKQLDNNKFNGSPMCSNQSEYARGRYNTTVSRTEKYKWGYDIGVTARTAGQFGGYATISPFTLSRDHFSIPGLSLGVIDITEGLMSLDISVASYYMGSVRYSVGTRFKNEEKPAYHITAGLGLLTLIGFVSAHSDFEGNDGVELGVSLSFPGKF
jgi:hypothetical protein